MSIVDEVYAQMTDLGFEVDVVGPNRIEFNIGSHKAVIREWTETDDWRMGTCRWKLQAGVGHFTLNSTHCREIEGSTPKITAGQVIEATLFFAHLLED